MYGVLFLTFSIASNKRWYMITKRDFILKSKFFVENNVLYLIPVIRGKGDDTSTGRTQ
jgi:hypothetical protein